MDLGSNSFHLLVATVINGQLAPLLRYKTMTQLAAGLDEKGYLQPLAVKNALVDLSKHSKRLKMFSPERVRVVGTNTLRVAGNAHDFLAKAEIMLGCPVDIIDGIEEARLIYRGVNQDSRIVVPARRLVVDIGGGSTELLVGKDTPDFIKSLDMGCVAYSRRFFADGKLSETEYQQAVNTVMREVQLQAEGIHEHLWEYAIGSSGTIRCIQKLLLHYEGMEHIHSEGLQRLSCRVLGAKKLARLSLPCVSPRRLAVLPGGLAVLHGLFTALEIGVMRTSQYSLREGVIYSLAGNY